MFNPLSQYDRVHAPAFIFIGGAESTPDRDLLSLLDLNGQERIEGETLWGSDRRQESTVGRSLVTIANSSKWVLLADDWLYRMWFNPETKHRLRELSRSFGDVFACSVGESDFSHDIRLLRDGELVREYVVDDPLTGPRHQVIVNRGQALAGELPTVQSANVTQYVLSVAAANGFDIDDCLSTARVWVDAPGSWHTTLTRISQTADHVTGRWFS